MHVVEPLSFPLDCNLRGAGNLVFLFLWAQISAAGLSAELVSSWALAQRCRYRCVGTFA